MVLRLILILVPVLLLMNGVGAVDHPNVVLVITDDQGWGDVGIHGNDKINTPSLDQLARDGVRLNRFYVSPVCAPTRASLMTGRYHLRTGVHGVTRGQETMRENEYTLAEAFSDNGYMTGCFGKWHNGAHYPHNPNGQGFDRFLGFSAGHWNNYFDTELESDGEMVRTEGFLVDVIAGEARQFIRRSQRERKPFFCYLSINTPHTPWQVPDKYFSKYENAGLDDEAACAYAMVEHLDHQVGAMRQTLDNLGILDDTIFIFMTDNGPNSNRFNGGMRGRKGSVHEGGMRVPFFIHWPGHIEGGHILEGISCHMDILPTLSSLCGLAVDPGIRGTWDGLDLTPRLMGRKDAWSDRMIFHKWGGSPDSTQRGSIRTQDFRAVVENGKWQLYDMKADPSQEINLASSGTRETSQVLKDLRSAWSQWHQDVTRDGFDPEFIQIGHTNRFGRVVRLPGHEALLQPEKGRGIRYHGPNGWANDWVDGWTSQESWPEWPVHVLESGDFSVVLRCSIPEASMGIPMVLEAGPAQLEFKIDKSFEGEQIASPDRIVRKEVYERTWRDWEIGTIRLEPGHFRLRIKALDSHSGEILDLKEVILTRIR